MKKIKVEYKDGSTVEYKSKDNVPDSYFLMRHQFSFNVHQITKQHYPLKDNELIVLVDNTDEGEF